MPKRSFAPYALGGLLLAVAAITPYAINRHDQLRREERKQLTRDIVDLVQKYRNSVSQGLDSAMKVTDVLYTYENPNIRIAYGDRPPFEQLGDNDYLKILEKDLDYEPLRDAGYSGSKEISPAESLALLMRAKEALEREKFEKDNGLKKGLELK